MVNLSGSLVLGVLVWSAVHHQISATWFTVVGTGLIGAYTSFTFDTAQLIEHGQWWLSTINVMVSPGTVLGAATLGLALGSLT